MLGCNPDSSDVEGSINTNRHTELPFSYICWGAGDFIKEESTEVGGCRVIVSFALSDSCICLMFMHES